MKTEDIYLLIDPIINRSIRDINYRAGNENAYKEMYGFTMEKYEEEHQIKLKEEDKTYFYQKTFIIMDLDKLKRELVVLEESRKLINRLYAFFHLIYLKTIGMKIIIKEIIA